MAGVGASTVAVTERPVALRSQGSGRFRLVPVSLVPVRWAMVSGGGHPAVPLPRESNSIPLTQVELGGCLPVLGPEVSPMLGCSHLTWAETATRRILAFQRC